VTVPGPYESGDPTWSQPGQPSPTGYGTQGSFIPQQSGGYPQYGQQYPQQYGPPGYQPGYPMYGVPMPMPRNGMGTAALVLGIVGVVLCWLYWVGPLLGVLAIIFGGVGLARAHSGQATNRSSALAGLILGIVALAGFIVLVLLIWQALLHLT
jgi:hypothetical protein